MKSYLRTISSLLLQLMSIIPLGVIFFLCPVFYSLCFVLIVRECFRITRKMYMSRERNLLEKFPGPRVYPVVGTLLIEMVFTVNFNEWSEKMCKRWGDPLRLWRFGQPVLFISSYANGMQILSKFNFPQNLDVISCFRSRSNGKCSIPEKTRYPQAFSEQAEVELETLIPIFSNETTKLLNKLQGYCETNQIFDLVKPLTKCVFKMVCQYNFGESYKTLSYDDNDDDGKVTCYMRAFQTIMKTMSSRILNPYTWHNMSDSIYYNFTEDGKDTRYALKTINTFGAMEIKRRRFNLTKSKSSAKTNNQNCYLDTLLAPMDKHRKKSTLNDDDIIIELNKSVSTFNSIAIAISRTLFLLAIHPTYQQHCFEEISKTVSKHEVPSSSSSFLKPMKYLDLCVKESIRLFPPTPILGLRTVNDVQLEDGRIIPQEVDIVIFWNLLQRDPNYFQDPDRFLPERHIDKMSIDNNEFNWFGGILGECIAKIVLSYLIKEYEWFVESDDKYTNTYQGLPYPKEEVKFRIRKRV